MKMNKKGFTLIEMLVVIAIIAILAAILIPTVTGATTKAKEAADVANIRSAIAEYEIKTLDNNTLALTKADITSGAKINYPDNLTVENDVVTYTATKLDGGTGDGNHTYTWNIGNLLTERAS